MEIISFEKRTFEEIAAKLDRFVQRGGSLCREHGGKETGEWMDQPRGLPQVAHQSENLADPEG